MLIGLLCVPPIAAVTVKPSELKTLPLELPADFVACGPLTSQHPTKS